MKWLNRSLFVSPIYYGLCTTEQEFHRELKKLKVPRSDWPQYVGLDQNSSSDATTHHIEHANGNKICIVCIGKTKGYSQQQIHALLVHEAVHIWQKIRTEIGETRPSSEFEAYAIQRISQSLIEAFASSRKRG